MQVYEPRKPLVRQPAIIDGRPCLVRCSMRFTRAGSRCGDGSGGGQRSGLRDGDRRSLLMSRRGSSRCGRARPKWHRGAAREHGGCWSVAFLHAAMPPAMHLPTPSLGLAIFPMPLLPVPSIPQVYMCAPGHGQVQGPGSAAVAWPLEAWVRLGLCLSQMPRDGKHALCVCSIVPCHVCFGYYTSHSCVCAGDMKAVDACETSYVDVSVRFTSAGG